MSNQKERIKKTIPGAIFVDDLETESKQANSNTSSVKKPPARLVSNEITSLTKKMGEIKVSTKITAEAQEADAKNKKIRKLKKTLREIEQIEEKLRKGENVEKEQMEKLKKREEVLDELEKLGDEV
jgi:partner of Y14 and mago protein